MATKCIEYKDEIKKYIGEAERYYYDEILKRKFKELSFDCKGIMSGSSEFQWINDENLRKLFENVTKFKLRNSHFNSQLLILQNKDGSEKNMIFDLLPNLESIEISNTIVDSHRDIKPVLDSILKRSDTLTELNLSGNYYPGKILQNTFDVISKLKNLKSLDISSISADNFIHYDTKIVSNSIKELTNLEDLNISDIQVITETLADDIRKIIESNINLRSLNISSNGLKHGEIESILKEAENRPNLKKIDFSFNDLSEQEELKISEIESLRERFSNLNTDDY